MDGQSGGMRGQEVNVFSVSSPQGAGTRDPHSSVSFLSFVPQTMAEGESVCRNKELVCSLMCLEKQDLCNKFKGACASGSPSARSPWVESKSMDYFFEGREGT